MLELQKIFLLVRFFNRISCNKGLKAKILSFFHFFLFTNPNPPLFTLALFTACFYHFLFGRYLNSSITRFLSDILLPFPNSNDLNSRDKPPNLLKMNFFTHMNFFTLSSAVHVLCMYVLLYKYY